MQLVPLIIRGSVITDADVQFGGRRPETHFTTADVQRHIDRLVERQPAALSDLYTLRFEQILDYLDELGRRLDFRTNHYLQEAFRLSTTTSGLTESILRHLYADMHESFARETVRRVAEHGVGIRFLDGWVETPIDRGVRSRVRAFGARSVHVVAGNVPGVSAATIIRGVVTRSDLIIKTPSNDPLTAVAIARTMIEMAPDHPITRHMSVAYWKGGDTSVETEVYQPRNIEKIIAWGGLASISHISRYLQPGIDLITLDPKMSSSIVGRGAFASEASMTEAARRLAHDIGIYNQEACLCARVVYVQSGTDAAGLELANRFGRMVYEQIQRLPPHVSAPQPRLDPALREQLEGLRFTPLYELVSGGGPEGGVIVSQIDEPVEFAHLLNNRVANLVPIDDLDTAIRATTSYTQTVGVHPPALIEEVCDSLALHGAQKVCSLGYAASAPIRSLAGPQDGMEPLRRMCKWVVQDVSDPHERPLAADR